jgi:hypothetical protein
MLNEVNGGGCEGEIVENIGVYCDFSKKQDRTRNERRGQEV